MFWLFTQWLLPDQICGFTLWTFLISVWFPLKHGCDSFCNTVTALSSCFVYFAPSIHTMFTLRCLVVTTVVELCSLPRFFSQLDLNNLNRTAKEVNLLRWSSNLNLKACVIEWDSHSHNTGSGQTFGQLWYTKNTSVSHLVTIMAFVFLFFISMFVVCLIFVHLIYLKHVSIGL